MTQKINMVHVVRSTGHTEIAIVEHEDNLKAYIMSVVGKYSSDDMSMADWASDFWFQRAQNTLSPFGVYIIINLVDFYPKYPGLDECLMNSEEYTQEQRELIIDAVGKWQNNEL